MRIVVDHLTRMSRGYICVAGIESPGARYVRPVIKNDRLWSGLDARRGGPFAVGALVDIGDAKVCGARPETEDHAFDPKVVARVKMLRADEFWKMLGDRAEGDLASIFGPALHPQSRSCAVDLGKGRCSLGAFRPPVRPTLFLNRWDKIKMRIEDAGSVLEVPVTDLRLVEDDHETPRAAAVADVTRRLAASTDVILSVGLSREFTAKGDNQDRHWLQVNGIHLRDDPLWQG